jgi:hypothetical protein
MGAVRRRGVRLDLFEKRVPILSRHARESFQRSGGNDQLYVAIVYF